MLKQRFVALVWMLAMAGCGSNSRSGVGDVDASDEAMQEASQAIDATPDAVIENAGSQAEDASAEPGTAEGDENAEETGIDAALEASVTDAAELGEAEEASDGPTQDGFGAIDGGSDASTEDVVTVDATPRSCPTNGSGTSQCGSSNESCCTSLEVPSGMYYRTYNYGDGGAPTQADPATVTAFRLDKYLVTVGRFALFVTAWSNGWRPAAGSGKHAHLNGGNGLAMGASPGAYEPGWLTTDNLQIAPTVSNLNCQSGFATWGNAANLPINCVNWFEAYAFCIWDGGFLPSEAEWELAAAGGSQQLEYPWGATAPGTSNEYAIYGCNFPSGSATCSGVTNIAPVGTATLGAGLWGQLDLAGEQWQWTADFYNSYATPCTDCASFTASTGRVARGGSSFSNASSLSPSTRGVGRPADRSYDFGFRCARSP